MSKIFYSSKPDALQIVFVDAKNVKKTKHASLLSDYQFDGNAGQTQLLLEHKICYIGVTYKLTHKTTDPYAKLDWYGLASGVVGVCTSIKNSNVQLCDPYSLITASALGHFLLGLLQSSKRYDEYVAKPKSIDLSIYLEGRLIDVLTRDEQNAITALHKALWWCREVVDAPPEAIYPQSLAAAIQENFASNTRTSVEVLSAAALEKMGMQAILHVGRASRHEPNMVVTTISPTQKKIKQRVVLVGKGITYDSGGLDIKTAGYMKTMKSDMAGSATVVAAGMAISEIGLEHTEVVVITALAENMISDNSYKSDDIITTYSGQTVEVHNTDAEGRLTLADALSYATTLAPDYIVDVATLTGAAIFAVGDGVSALMGNDTRLVAGLEKSAVAEGELMVTTPMLESMRSAVQGDISDLINTSKLKGQVGHTTAGLFLSFFINQANFRSEKLKLKSPKEYAWAHIDIAGSAHNSGTNALKLNGATAQTVRTLVSWIQALDKK